MNQAEQVHVYLGFLTKLPHVDCFKLFDISGKRLRKFRVSAGFSSIAQVYISERLQDGLLEGYRNAAIEKCRNQLTAKIYI